MRVSAKMVSKSTPFLMASMSEPVAAFMYSPTSSTSQGRLSPFRSSFSDRKRLAAKATLGNNCWTGTASVPLSASHCSQISRASLNATAYYYEVTDPQFTAIGGEGNFNQLINADKGEGYGIEMKDESPSARPGLNAPLAQDLVRLVKERTGRDPLAKLGWTDVARFSQLGIPAVNLGAGDPLLAHKHDEQVPESDLTAMAAILTDWLV